MIEFFLVKLHNRILIYDLFMIIEYITNNGGSNLLTVKVMLLVKVNHMTYECR